MKTEKGNYEMFHHQYLHILKNEEGKLLQALNIHTNIQHLTMENAYTVLVSGIGNRKDFHQMHYNMEQKNIPHEVLSKSETEILGFIAKGYSASEISKILNISFYTVRTHRKNILKKTIPKIPRSL
ncbi:helix-turn-helix transcriptional regulator [Chryseobacterium sp. RR2-3-20]|uniref:helix-turn-helix transcriptional regulator n=1 Tax=Chryseobacterium sp. RR2-3-20 TaxID=2787626 RepID=UPI001FD77C6C|nr:helix-turn-helix transcriptional regulator [Chryseobacterium sp. RR2-3-20]